MLKLMSVVLFFCAGAIAAADPVNEVSIPTPQESLHSAVANINQGNYEVGGTFSMSYSSAYIDTSFSPYFRYFLFDRFSAGFVTQGSFGNNYSSFGAGPSFAFYFLNAGHWAFSLGEDLLVTRTTENAYNYSDEGFEPFSFTTGLSVSKLAANYFVTPAVAVGPTLSYNIVLGEGQVPTNNYLSLLGQFSVFF